MKRQTPGMRFLPLNGVVSVVLWNSGGQPLSILSEHPNAPVKKVVGKGFRCIDFPGKERHFELGETLLQSINLRVRDM